MDSIMLGDWNRHDASWKHLIQCREGPNTRCRFLYVQFLQGAELQPKSSGPKGKKSRPLAAETGQSCFHFYLAICNSEVIWSVQTKLRNDIMLVNLLGHLCDDLSLILHRFQFDHWFYSHFCFISTKRRGSESVRLLQSVCRSWEDESRATLRETRCCRQTEVSGWREWQDRKGGWWGWGKGVLMGVETCRAYRESGFSDWKERRSQTSLQALPVFLKSLSQDFSLWVSDLWTSSCPPHAEIFLW